VLDAVTRIPAPVNEPVHSYAPGSPERARLEAELKRLGGQEPVELTMAIDGERRLGRGEPIDVVQPHRHAAVLGTMRNATREDAEEAVQAALAAAPAWRALSFDDRAAIFLKAADLLAGPWRETLAAATMLGQSKTAQQAEIDTPCELVDFWRFNVHFAREILAEQPESSPGVWNRSDHRPLEGFVYAITPFNFTAIAGNLPTAPALMGNTVVWKPSPTQQFAAHLLMDLLEEAGLPAGVINMVTGDGLAVSEVALHHRDLGENITNYRSYPRLVGETGGKDFLVAHPSADPAALRTLLTRGAFEYQGQKCSALSRAYIPASLWAEIKDGLRDEVQGLTMGDVTDLGNFLSAVIDARAFAKSRWRCWPAAATTTRSATSSGLPCWSARTRRPSTSGTSTSARSSPSTSSTTPGTRRCWTWSTRPPATR
jgi:1-pyrroline-5-carboxylate dehydrogenase